MVKNFYKATNSRLISNSVIDSSSASFFRHSSEVDFNGIPTCIGLFYVHSYLCFSEVLSGIQCGRIQIIIKKTYLTQR